MNQRKAKRRRLAAFMARAQRKRIKSARLIAKLLAASDERLIRE